MKDREADAEQELRDLDVDLKRFTLRSPEERAYVMIRLFFTTYRKEPHNENEFPEITCRRFISWLLDQQDSEEKGKALERVFREMFEESGRASGKNNRRPRKFFPR